MAFANFMISNSYANIQDVMYCKQRRHVGFSLVVYTDDQKTQEIARLQYSKFTHGVQAPVWINADWDAFFGVDKITGTSDLLKQIYIYLKTLPEFANVQDV